MAPVRKCYERRERAGSGRRPKARQPERPATFPGTLSKEPISTDATKLVYYDEEHKAIYTGNVDTVVKLTAQVAQTLRRLRTTTNSQMDR